MVRTIVSWASGRLDVFATFVDGQLWHRWFDGQWHEWEPLGGSLSSGPDAASWAPGRLDVFMRVDESRGLGSSALAADEYTQRKSCEFLDVVGALEADAQPARFLEPALKRKTKNNKNVHSPGALKRS